MPDPLQQAKLADVLAIAAAVGLPTLVTAAYFLWPAGQDSVVVKVLYGVGKVVQFGFPLIWVMAVKRQPLDFYERGEHSLLYGILFGLIVSAGMAWLYFQFVVSTSMEVKMRDAVTDKLQTFGLLSPMRYLALTVFYAAAHSFLEEYYYRWFIFGQLEAMSTFPIALAVSSIGFALHHYILLGTYLGWANPWAFALTACVGIGGVVWAYLYERSDSLIGVWISHGIIDAAIFAVGWHLISTKVVE